LIVLLPIFVLAMQAAPGVVVGTLRAANIRPMDAVVYLVPLDQAPDSVSDTTTTAATTIDQRDLRFVPRVLALSPGSTVEFLNSDPLLHNVFSPPGPGPGFDLGVYARGERREIRFSEAGGHVILCHIHPEMLAYVVIVDSPYRTTSDREGHFRFEGIPAGPYELRVWHRRLDSPRLPIEVTSLSPVTLDLFLDPRPRHRQEQK